ncbi:HemK2/MTQ2 family protein methyltransferase [Halosimplex pelagicum]|uniref:Methyltransferase domain-containing protein n=1 Tax=Halosimplex pelagicum TaxID=869886 RepID=A0A7D5TDY9_9EURY|nr:HemK2/MTQ2 family protein methyltransferase [Halosimplex pelagicum]QLH84209.1 methyltransferase domain-containing protein [Halosimplex pelagicum]
MSEDESDGDGTADESGGKPGLAAQRDVEQVYQPAEDSKLLADAVVERVGDGDRALDVGTGSGYVAARMREAGADAVGTDLNPHACRQAAEAGIPAVRADLTGPFRDGSFDAVTFNPPYLPTEPDREWDDWMERALSGGEDGRAAIDPFLDDVSRVLAPGGAAYLLVSSLTDPDAVRERAAENGLASEEVASESHPFETLLVVRFARDDQ